MKKILSYTWLVLVALFMYIPVLILAFYSFTDSTTIGAVRGFSLHNYETLFTTEELRNMIVGTLLLAVGSAVIASVLGTVGAIGAFLFQTLYPGCCGDCKQDSGSQCRCRDGVLHLYSSDRCAGN